MKLANKIGLSFFTVTVICTVAAVSFLYFAARDEMLRAEETSLTSFARFRAAHIETYLGMLKISIGQLSKSVVLETFLKMPDSPNIQQSKEFEQAMTRLRRTKEVNPAIDEFLLLDKTGKAIASSEAKSIGSDKSADPVFLGGQKEIFIKDAYYSETLRAPAIAVSAPLTDSQSGDFLGVLVARVKLNDLWNITTERVGSGDTREIIIINKDKALITPSRFLPDTFLKQKVDTTEVRQAFLHQDNRFVRNIFHDYRGVQVMAAHGYIPQMQWVVIAKIDAQEALAPLIELRRNLLLILFIAVLVAWLLSRSIARLIAGPIKKLREGTDIVGAGNLDYKVGTGANDEVGQLARAFDTMTASLKTKTTSIENLNIEIAGRKMAEESLQSKTALLEAQLNASLDGIIVVDNQGKKILQNWQVSKLWKIPQNIADNIDDEQQVQHVKNMTQKPEQFVEKIVYLYHHPDETSRDEVELIDGTILERYSAPVLGERGQNFGRIWTFRDITARKQAELKIRQAKEDWEHTFDSVPDLICLIDELHTITRINRAMANLLGIKPEEAIGRKCYTCVHKTDQPPASCPHVQLLADGKEHETEIKDEKLGKWLNVTVSPLRDGKGNIVGAIHVARDVTQRKLAEEALSRSKNDLEKAYRQLQESFELESKLTIQAQTASTVKSQFVANISHELRTPLNGIHGICELLLGTEMTKEQMEYARIIKSSASALLNIINATLDFSKIEAGKMDLEKIDFNLRDITENIAGMLRVDAANKQLALVSYIEPNVPVNLNGDPGRLRQILYNLIGNAVKFTQKGEIAVNVAMTEEKEDRAILRFTVRDTGIGIPEDKKHLLFKAFSQVDSSLARKFGGTGLGLAISKGLIEQMGGSIGVESAQGQGSTFWFTVPFLKQRADAHPSEPPKESTMFFSGTHGRTPPKHAQYQPGTRLRILVAEDNMANQMVILGILAKMGHTAVAVANGKEAIDALATIPYDLVLMDIQMPVMDGFEASRRIREMETAKQRSEVSDQRSMAETTADTQPSSINHQPFFKIPILALSAHTMSEDRDKCLAAGMNGYITKPVSTESIAAAIAQIILPESATTSKTIRKNAPSVIFDSKAFSERLSGDNDLIRNVTNVFLDETPRNICALENTIKNQQKEAAARLAHTIKGAAANIGGEQLRAVALKLEKACNAADWHEAAALVPRLNKQFEFLEQAMRDFVKI